MRAFNSVHCKGCSPAGGVSAGVVQPGLGRETGKLAALVLLEASLAEPWVGTGG